MTEEQIKALSRYIDTKIQAAKRGADVYEALAELNARQALQEAFASDAREPTDAQHSARSTTIGGAAEAAAQAVRDYENHYEGGKPDFERLARFVKNRVLTLAK